MSTVIRTAATLALFLPALASAQDNLSFSTSVDLNYKKLVLSSLFVNTSTGVATENEFRPSLWMLNVSPSLAWKGLFLTASVERSLGESSTAGQTSAGWQERHYSREENSLTAGYNIWAGLTAFAGYFDNITRINFIQSSSTSSAPTSFGRNKLIEKGPYYGLAYAHRFSGGGSLAASFAVARAHGESETVNSAGGSASNSGTGTVRGNSFGLSWSAPLTNTVYYRLGYKGTRYNFAFTDNFGFERRTKQNYDAYFLGIANYF